MSQTLLLLSYNNYFNRIIKQRPSLEEFIKNYDHDFARNIAFNPNDGVTTEQIINWSNSFNPDYCIVLNDYNEIMSCWFITEAARTRNGQYRLSLKRDLISDFYDKVVDSPCFIEKGFVSSDNPLIYNREDFISNQIKTNEMLLRDKSYISWIVLYYNLSKKSSLSGTVSTISEHFYNIGTTLNDFALKHYETNPYKLVSDRNVIVYARDNANENVIFAHFDKNFSLIRGIANRRGSEEGIRKLIYKNTSSSAYDAGLKAIKNVENLFDANKSNLQYQLSQYGNEPVNFETFVGWNNKIIKTSDNQFYKISITPVGQEDIYENVTSGSLFNSLRNCFFTGGVINPNWGGTFEDAFRVKRTVSEYSVSFENITNTVETLSFDFTNAKDIMDQPYGIIALPYLSKDSRKTRFDLIDLNPNISLLVARELCKAGVGPDKVIYDAQILPYCPVNLEAQLGLGYITLWTSTLPSDSYKFISNSSNAHKSFALFPDSAKFTKNIDVRTEMVRDFNYDQTKVENQCTFYRLVSPNYNGQFEFNRAKNIDISYINVDCTYKPYTPYIHLNPDFKGLYGREFNDARGLVCGGDFSLSIASDAFETYKLQNKNFNEIFDRQIENMDTQYDISKTKNLVGLGLGLGKGVVGGAIAGGNPLSIGLGAATGLASGITNLVTAEQSYKEQRDLSIDMHNFQLQNIQALPDSLTKVDAYNNNNKIFPILEKYTCTDEEKEIFKNKLKYEGMTVNAIGNIRDYLQFGELTFVKGRMIRLDSINDDSHLLYAIYDEIMKGVYL